MKIVHYLNAVNLWCKMCYTCWRSTNYLDNLITINITVALSFGTASALSKLNTNAIHKVLLIIMPPSTVHPCHHLAVLSPCPSAPCRGRPLHKRFPQRHTCLAAPTRHQNITMCRTAAHEAPALPRHVATCEHWTPIVGSPSHTLHHALHRH